MKKQHYRTFQQWYDDLANMPRNQITFQSMRAFWEGDEIVPTDSDEAYKAFNQAWEERWEIKLSIAEIKAPGWYNLGWKAAEKAIVCQQGWLRQEVLKADEKLMSRWADHWFDEHPTNAHDPLMVVQVEQDAEYGLWIKRVSPTITGGYLRVRREIGVGWVLEEVGDKAFFQVPLTGWGTLPFLRALMVIDSLFQGYYERSVVILQWIWAAGEGEVTEKTREALGTVNDFLGKRNGVTVSRAKKAARQAWELANATRVN